MSAARIDLAHVADPRPVRRKRSSPPGRRLFSSWRVVAAFALGFVTLVGSAFLAASIAAPQSWFGEVSPLAWVHDARASTFLEKTRPTISDLDTAERESWTALRQAPVDDVAWLALAQADRLRHGRMTESGLKWLQRSYDVAPFGPDTSLWRIRFALNNWTDLTPELRRDVVSEFRSDWPQARDDLQNLAPNVEDPAGRLAYRMMLMMSSAPS